MAYPAIPGDSVGWVTEAEMVEVDRAMIDDLGISLVQMMENAGRSLARAAIDLFAPSSVWVAAGSGGNGGGGMVAARHLTNAGVAVTVTTTRPGHDLSGVPARQLETIRRMGVTIADAPSSCDLAIDALIGYSLRGAPRGHTAELIAACSQHPRTLSLDTPSGIDVTTGDAPGTFVTADATVTLALPKAGLRGHPAVGRLLLADISVPLAITEPLGGSPDFGPSPILELVGPPGGPT